MSLTAATLFLPHDLGVLAAEAYMFAIMALVGLPCIAVWALVRQLAARVAGAAGEPHGVQCGDGGCAGDDWGHMVM